MIEEEFSTGVSIFILSYIAIKKFGPAVTQYRDKLGQVMSFTVKNIYDHVHFIVDT